MQAGRFTPTLLGLLGCAGGLAALYAALVEGGPVAPPVLPPLPELPALPQASAAAEDRTEPWLATTLARPLFDPRRRPAAAAVAGVPAAQGLPRLTGVVVGDFGASAIFEARAGGRPLVLREGDQVEAYVVQSILPGEATLLGPDGRHVLRPAFQSKGPAARASAGAVPDPAMRWDGAGGSRGS